MQHMLQNDEEQMYRSVLTPWSVQSERHSPIMVGGEGRYLIDKQGKRYLDLSSGWSTVNLAYGHPKVIKALQEQVEHLCWAPPTYLNDVRAEYAASLIRVAPWEEGGRVHFTTGGGEANDDAIKIAHMLTGRPKVLATYRSYHGATKGSSGLTGDRRRWSSEPGPPGIVRFFAPYPYRSPFHALSADEEVERALEHVERVLLHEDPSRVAALIIEPVVGSNGVIVYPDGYLAGLRDITQRHSILLIFDEVQTGFGRVGETFAAQRLEVIPDLITFAKGASSAYVPLGGVLVRESLACHFDQVLFDAGHTYAGHILSVTAGKAVLQAYLEEGLFKRAYEIEGWLKEGLNSLQDQHPLIGDVRGLGAFFGLELVRDRWTKEPIVPWHHKDAGIMQDFYAFLLQEGVHAYGRYNIVVIDPPLTITRDELQIGLNALDRALTRLQRLVSAGENSEHASGSISEK